MSGEQVRAAVLRAYGGLPSVEERPGPAAPSGHVLVDVHAVPITPLDVLCATGTSYFGRPPLPYVPGVQGVGVARSGELAGTRVWFPTSAGMRPGDGSLASTVSVPATELVALPGEVPATVVAALGLSAVAARCALLDRGGLRPGEQVVVLGAGGVVGQVAVQLARRAGARRVVAGCRSEAAAARALRSGADTVVRLDTDDVEVLAARFLDGCDGAADLVLDPLAGAPAAAALRALGPGGRLVHLGSSAGPALVLDSATLRGRSLAVLGYTNNDLTAGQRAAALHAVLAAAGDGLMVDAETVPLDGVPQAWERQATGRAAVRLVVDLVGSTTTKESP